MEKGIKIENIEMAFPSGEGYVNVLHGINLDLKPGELTLLVGPSGCGKTTLISIISAILTPTKGKILIDGQSIHDMNDEEKVLFRRKNIGFIFQQYNLLTTLTAEENVAIPLIASDVPMDIAINKADKILGKIGMEKHIHKKPNQLSGGQQQRVAIARALIHDPQLIVCDEPTAALDAHTGLKVMEILQTQAKKDGRVVIIVTHDNRIFHFADRMIVMSDGKVVEDKLKGELNDSEFLNH